MYRFGRWCFLVAALLIAVACKSSGTAGGEPQACLTRAEASGFTETSRYADVIEILEALEAESELMRLSYFGESAEGRKLPLVILGDPPPASPAEVDPGLTKVFVNANIHAGEVEGKEACVMLIREIVRGPLRELLDGKVLLVAPIYNSDGNERIQAENRFWQGGPDKGVGIRTNAQHLDLNRDMMKLESPEAQSLVRNVLVEWDPHLVVDCHTTNGSHHREPITYAPPVNPLMDRAVLDYHNQEMLPWVVQRTLQRDGYRSIPYGNFVDRMHPEQGWKTFDHRPRYVNNYAGLRNRLSILIEMYAYAAYETRVRGCLSFLRSILEFSTEEGEAMRALVAAADLRTLAAAEAGSLRFHWQFEQAAFEEPLLIQGYAMQMGTDPWGRERPVPIEDQPVDYEVPYFGRYEISDEGVVLPAAYVFPFGMKEVREKLALHGIEMEHRPGDFTAELQYFDIEQIEAAEDLNQGHRNHSLSGKWETEQITLHGGVVIVPTAQPQAMLAAYLLEPQSDDGLTYWNLLDRYLTRHQWDPSPGRYPIMRWQVYTLPSR